MKVERTLLTWEKLILFVFSLLVLTPFKQHAYSQPSTHSETFDPCARASEALSIASQIRSLEIRKPVQCRALAPQEYRKLAHWLVLRDVRPSQLKYEQEVLAALGFIPENYAYARCLVDAYATSAAAFYSPTKGYFVVPNWTETPFRVLVHEATHALQDQHFSTRKFGIRPFLFDDENLAAGALLEGDAMSVENEFAESASKSDNQDPDEFARLPELDPNCSLPAILEELGHGMYDYGTNFVNRVLKAGGHPLLNQVFAAQPKNTRAILHFEQWQEHVKRRELSSLSLSNPFTKKSEPIRLSLRFGEMGIRTLFKHSLPLPQALLSASGLVVDQADLYLNPKAGCNAVSWRSSWDTAEKARQFYKALISVWEKRNNISLNYRPAQLRVSTASGKTYEFQIRDRQVGLFLYTCPN